MAAADVVVGSEVLSHLSGTLAPVDALLLDTIIRPLESAVHSLSIPGVVLASALVWQGFEIMGYFITQMCIGKSYSTLPKSLRADYACRFSAFIHAVVISLLSLVIVCRPGLFPELQADRIFGTTPFSSGVYAIAGGYFVWDLVFCLLNFETSGWAFLMHAIGSLTLYSLVHAPYLHYYGAVFLLFELSTPLVHLRWLAIRHQWPSADFLTLAFGLSFIAVRGIFGWYQTIKYVMDVVAAYSQTEPRSMFWLYLVGNLFFNSLNIYWVMLMVRSYFRVQGKKKKAAAAAGGDGAASPAKAAAKKKSQ